MPEAEPFSTRGAYNGLPSCFEKVDVSEFDYWTTFSGYNEESSGSVTQAQIEQSLQAAGKLYWRLRKVHVDTFTVPGGLDTLPDLVVNGQDWVDPTDSLPLDDSIEPRKRGCGGSLSTATIALLEGEINLTIAGNFTRMYDGPTDDEDNFVGYGMGEMSLDGGSTARYAPLINSFFGSTGRPMALLGSYGDESLPSTSEVYGYGHVEVVDDTNADNVPTHMLFMGYGLEVSGPSPITTVVNVSEMSVTSTQSGSPTAQAKFESFEFYTYPA
jgi:hypothetical protein